MKNTVVLFPAPGEGHLVSTIQLAKRLLTIAEDTLSVTVLIIHLPPVSSGLSSHTAAGAVAASGLDIHFTELPPVIPTVQRGLPNHLEHIENYKDSVAETLSAMKSATTISAFVVDMFCTSMITVSRELNIPSFVFFTSGAATLATFLFLPTIDEKHEVGIKDLKEDIEIPGVTPMPPSSFPLNFQEKNEFFQWCVRAGHSFRQSDGVLVNTFYELQPRTIKALQEGLCCLHGPTPPVYPVGPLLHSEAGSESSGHECIQWLDRQPRSSVLFLCFGSMGTFATDQIHEIAGGLEGSGHRFLWCLRFKPPATSDRVHNSIVPPPQDADLNEVLPAGFVERTADRGLVWPKWAPQVAILSHPAVGGFVSHCGWNSTLESIWFGVPMITWPLYAEQGMNAVELVKELGLAVSVKREGLGVNAPGRGEELEKSVKELMDGEGGERVRQRMKETSELARKAIGPGGSSRSHLEELVEKWRARK